MELRTATPSDAPVLLGMATAFREHLQRPNPTDAQFLEGLPRLLSADDACFCMALEGQVPLGYLLLRHRFSMWAPGLEGNIEDLFVLPAHRGKGVGRRLLRFALDQARALGCVTVCVDTNEKNAVSTRLYLGAGFDAVSRRWQGRQIFYRLDFE